MCIAILIDVWKEDITCCLVQNSCYTKDKNRPRVRQHLLCQGHIKQFTTSKETIFQLFPEAESNGTRTYKVNIEGKTNLMSVENKVINDVQNDIQCNEQELESSKLYRSFLVSKVCKRNTLEGIYSNGNSHHPHIRGVIWIPHKVTNGLQEDENQCDEQ